MPATKYTYSLTSDFPNQKVDMPRLTQEIQGSATIVHALDYINSTTVDCDVWFKDTLASGEATALDAIVDSHSGELLPETAAPTMSDGRPLVRADTRPLSTSTYFSCASDTASGIGDGADLRWDFAPDSEYTTISGPYTLSCGHEIPEGYNAQVIDMYFLDSVYLKDGAIYFFDAPWGARCYMFIIVPQGNYYPNDHGAIPASSLGLPGTQTYSYASTDTPYYTYVNKHYMYTDCPMGDELNAEGAMVDALPPGWIVRGVILVPNNNNVCKGFASFEMYRHRSVIKEGDSP